MGQDPIRGRVELPSNESVLNTLSNTNRHNYMKLRQSTFEIAKERPDLDTRLYTRYLHDYLDAASKAEKTNKAKIAAAKAKKPDMNWSELREVTKQENNASQEEYGKFLGDFSKTVVPKFGAEGQEAWKELHNKMQGSSIIGAAASQIYDKKKGGMQWGGIVGLILGGLMATQLTGGGIMTGELLPILATVGTAFLGAWLGNKAADGIGNMLKPDPTPAPSPKPERSTTPAAEPQNPITPEVKDKAKNAVNKPPASTAKPPAADQGPSGGTKTPLGQPTQEEMDQAAIRAAIRDAGGLPAGYELRSPTPTPPKPPEPNKSPGGRGNP